jgi:hypothetical protein
LQPGDAAQATPTFSFDATTNTFRVSVEVTIDTNTRGKNLITGVAHEGRHVADAQEFAAAANADIGHQGFAGIAGPLNRTKYEREFRAYTVTSLVAQGLGLEGWAMGGNEIWYKGWAPANRAGLRSQGINTYLKGAPYRLSRQSTGTRYVPFEWRALIPRF